MKAVIGSSRFQPGEGPSRGLLRDYEPSDGPFLSTNVTHDQPSASAGSVLFVGVTSE